jgi:hypothetical protein
VHPLKLLVDVGESRVEHVTLGSLAVGRLGFFVRGDVSGDNPEVLFGVESVARLADREPFGSAVVVVVTGVQTRVCPGDSPCSRRGAPSSDRRHLGRCHVETGSFH